VGVPSDSAPVRPAPTSESPPIRSSSHETSEQYAPTDDQTNARTVGHTDQSPVQSNAYTVQYTPTVGGLPGRIPDASTPPGGGLPDVARNIEEYQNQLRLDGFTMFNGQMMKIVPGPGGIPQAILASPLRETR